MCETATRDSYYRARYYDSSLGRFLLEDPLDFAGGNNFYRYVGNNPVKRKDPLGLWQFTFGGGLGLGAQLTFGNNGGQYNFGLSSGVGEGAYFNLDPTDSGGCHKGGAYGVTNVHLSLGEGHAHHSRVRHPPSLDGSDTIDNRCKIWCFQREEAAC
jgi:uncharacterized protein RhaS with RHS repeats